jgi:hypothetical protein
MKRHIVTVCTTLCLLCTGVAFAQTKRALIIGIDTYQPAGTTAQHPGCAYGAYSADGRCALGTFPNLEGAVNDAQSMADVLTSTKYKFPNDKVVLLTNPGPTHVRTGVEVLPAAQTNHDGILAAMQKYLVDLPQKGDTVVFYDASHGSLRVNTAGEKLSVRTSEGQLVHVDSTLVPSDAYKGAYDIRDREMTRIFNAALNKGVLLTVIFDSCHSGGSTRGIGGQRKRSLPYDPRPVTDAEVLAKPTERQGNPALVFAAVQQDQSANETDPTVESPEIHGAFTAALIETLQILPADAPASLVYQRVKAVLEGQGTVGQEPDLDAGPARRQQPLFGGASNSADGGKVRAEALKTDNDGSIWLDIGMVSGIGPKSEFTTDPSSGKTIKLRVTEPLGIARSRAIVVSPVGAKVAVGEVFNLTKLVPSQSDPLLFWVSPTNLSTSDILAAVAQIKASGVATISDAAEEPYTDILSWDGAAWMLQHVTPAGADQSSAIIAVDVKSESPVKLGPTLSAAALKRATSVGTKLWVELPASRELVAKLKLSDPDSEAQSATRIADAHYILAGSIAGGNPAYAWFHKDEYTAGPRVVATSDHTPGCSTSSPYPVRSDWVSIADAAIIQQTAETLNTYSIRLARVHGWLELANNQVAGAPAANYYKLALVHMTDTNPVSATDPARENDRMRLALQADAPVKESRWVYVLDIDCHGKGTLLYPRDYAENQYPSQGDTDSQIILRHAPTIRISAPFGVDTMILLTTAQPLSDPYVLDFEGVARSVDRGVKSPLEKLLSNASSGTRGIDLDVEIPTDWGIQLKTVHSVPLSTAQ